MTNVNEKGFNQTMTNPVMKKGLTELNFNDISAIESAYGNSKYGRTATIKVPTYE